MRSTILGVLMALTVGSCGSTAEEARVETWWINSFKVPCVGVGPMECLQVHDGEGPFGEWRYLYQPIDGFDFRPGMLYRVKVKVIELPPDRVPADASSLRYVLTETLDRVPDPRMPLHDIYVQVADDANAAQVSVEFNVVQGRYMGRDACGEFEGEILYVDGEALTLGTVNAIDAECAAGTGLRDALPHVAAWRRDGLRLELLDAAGTVRLNFRKVD